MAVEELGGYRLIEKLGSGGMGVVYLGMDAENNPVAVKVLHPNIANDETSRKRLAREVRTLRRIKHPRIASVLDAELESSQPFIVTDFVDGLTLSDDVKENGPFAEDELVHFGHGLLDALVAVHNAGVVHRDLKPANVMIMDGEPMVIDFGIAQAADEVKVTVTGLVMGTPGYLSPEIVDGKPSSEKTDWWGWGATVAFAATGRNPYGTGSIETVIARVATGKANLEGCPERFKPLIMACLDPNPDRRPSGPQILEALTEIEAGQMPSLGRAPQVPPASFAQSGQTMVQPAVPPFPGQPGVAQVGYGASQAPVGYPNGPAGARPAAASSTVIPAVYPNQQPPGYQPAQPAAGHSLMGSPRSSHPGTGMPAQPVNAPGYTQYGSAPQGSGPQAAQYASSAVPPEVLAAQRQAELHRELQLKAHARTLALWPILGLIALAGAMSPMLPIGLLIVAVAWQVVARTIGTVSRKNRIREARFGPGSAGSGLTSAPGALFGSLFSSLAASLMPLVAAVAVAILMRLDIAGIVPPAFSEEFAVWFGALAFAVVLWLGPGSANLRLGSRVLISQVLGNNAMTYTMATLICIVLALLAIITITTGVGSNWLPLPENPFTYLPARV